jgi:hypothetical protein
MTWPAKSAARISGTHRMPSFRTGCGVPRKRLGWPSGRQSADGVDAIQVRPEAPQRRAAQVASVPMWSSSDPSIVVSPSADGLSALLTAGTTPVKAATVTATASLLADATAITGTTDPIDVVAQVPVRRWRSRLRFRRKGGRLSFYLRVCPFVFPTWRKMS